VCSYPSLLLPRRCKNQSNKEPFFMASISPTCSPTSLQLRLAFNATKFPPSYQARFGNINHRVRPLRSVHNDATKGAQSVDGFSGWSDSETGEQQGNDSKNKKSYGGMYGSSNSNSC
jgi:hypothetical protein